MKIRIERFVEMIFLSIKIVAHSFIFPGYKSLTMLTFAAIITCLSVTSYFAGLPTLIDWRGSLVATLILLFLFLIRKKGE